MKKFSITQLETARKNPTGFAKILSDPSTANNSGFTKYMAWQFAIFNYHKTNDLSKGINYFDHMFHQKFADNSQNRREFSTYMSSLDSYSKEFIKQGLVFVEHKKRIEIIFSNKLKMSGELPVICMNIDSGYTVYFFSKDSTTWEDELRFPIVQSYVAKILYKVDLSEIKVGVFDVYKEKFSLNTYSKDDVETAVKELYEIGNTISSLLK